MDSLNGLFFPRTNAQYALFRQLLICFESVTLYQAAEDFEADSWGLGEAGLLQQTVPAPFGEELDTFKRLVHGMVGQSADAYGGFLLSLSNAAQVDVDEATVWSLIGGMKGQGETGTRDVKQDELLKARILLRLAEIHDRQEEEIARALAEVDMKKNLFLEDLKGEGDQELAAALQALPTAPEERSRFRQRLKAWGRLFLADPEHGKRWLLVTDQEDGLDLLCMNCQELEATEVVLELPLPGLGLEQQGEESIAELRNRFAQEAGESLAVLCRHLAAVARTGQGEEEAAVQQAVAGWQQGVEAGFSEGRRGTIRFHLFRNRSLASLFADLCGGVAPESVVPHGLVGLITDC